MIIGIGTDIIEIDRIASALKRNRKKLLSRIGSPSEIASAPKAGSPNEAPFWAARFAAKEAFSKAFGTGFGPNLFWNEVGIQSELSGKPNLVYSKRLATILKKKRIVSLVTLSHSHDNAIAFVVLERS